MRNQCIVVPHWHQLKEVVDEPTPETSSRSRSRATNDLSPVLVLGSVGGSGKALQRTEADGSKYSSLHFINNK